MRDVSFFLGKRLPATTSRFIRDFNAANGFIRHLAPAALDAKVKAGVNDIYKHQMDDHAPAELPEVELKFDLECEETIPVPCGLTEEPSSDSPACSNSSSDVAAQPNLVPARCQTSSAHAGHEPYEDAEDDQ